MATIGRLAVQITAETAGLAAGLKSADGQITTFGQKADMLVGKLKMIGPAAALAGAGLAGAMIRNVANTADALAKLSAKTGVAVEDLSRLQYAAGLSGVSNEQLSGSLTKLSKNMADAVNGSGDAAGAFDAMGLSVKNADGTLKSQRQVLEELADKFQGYADGAEKSALAQRVFGRSGADLIPLLNAGAAGIKDMADESDRLGNTISTKTAKAAERFNDNITRLETAVGGLSRRIAGPMIQSLADMTDRMNEAQKSGSGLLGILDAIIKGGSGKRTNIEDAANDVKSLWKEYNKLQDMTAGQDVGSEAVTKAEMAYSKYMDAMRNYNKLLTDQIAGEQKLNEVRSAPVISNGDTPGKPDKVAGGGAAAKPIGSIFDDGDPVANELAKRFEESDSGDAAIARQEARDKEYAAYTEDLNRKLLALTEYTKTEEQLILDRQTKQTEDLILLREEGLITEQDYMLREQDMAMKHMEELARIRGNGEKAITDITRMNWSERASFMIGKMAEMTAGIASSSKAAFNINKAAAIGQAIMDTQAGAARALKDFPAPWSYAVAGATYAQGIARVSAIKSQQFGGSGGAGGAGGSTSLPSAPSNSAAAGGQAMNQTISVQGISSSDLFSGDAVRTLIDRLIDAQRNGARIVLA
jgi:hypothetical protein